MRVARVRAHSEKLPPFPLPLARSQLKRQVQEYPTSLFSARFLRSINLARVGLAPSFSPPASLESSAYRGSCRCTLLATRCLPMMLMTELGTKTVGWGRRWKKVWDVENQGSFLKWAEYKER